MVNESFGELLARIRKSSGLTQEDLAKELNLPVSRIAMLETGKRGKHKALSREELWRIILMTRLWPPACDTFLAAAGMSTDRSEDEEHDIQERFDLKEMWIFARVILDPDRKWFKLVSENIIKKEVTYRYFTSDDDTFLNFVDKLKDQLGATDEMLRERLECFVLPHEVFPTNFALYNPGEADMYCCGTKTQHGKAVTFYTSSEGPRLYEWLKKWRQRIFGGRPIELREAQRIYPSIKMSIFKSPHQQPNI